MFRSLPTTFPLALLLGSVLGVLGCVAPGTTPDAGGSSLDRELVLAIRASGAQFLVAESVPEEQVALGRSLMYDPILSGNRDVACATCHRDTLVTGDRSSLAIGTGGRGSGPTRQLPEDGDFLPRHAPEIFNRGHEDVKTMFWDRRVRLDEGDGLVSPAGSSLPEGVDSVLAAAAMIEVVSRPGMRGTTGDFDIEGEVNELAVLGDEDYTGVWTAVMDRLRGIPEYVGLFEAAYPGVEVSTMGFEYAANAIAAYQTRAWTLTSSPFDLYLQGNLNTLNLAQKRGGVLFYGKARCASCHSGSLLTDQEVHNLAVPQIGPGVGASAPLDFGAELVSGSSGDRYGFRTPPLRNVTRTGPWMHNGCFTTLEAAVRHHLDPMASYFAFDPTSLDARLQGQVRDSPDLRAELFASLDPVLAEPVVLTDEEVEDLLAFLQALTDPIVDQLSANVPLAVPSGLAVGGL